MKIGCCGNTEYYAQISKMGYDYIELSGRQLMSLSEYQREDFFKEYDAAQFPCLAINDYCGADVPIVGPDFTIKGARAYAARISEAAARLGAKGLGIGAPMARKLPAGYSEEKALFEMMSFLYVTCDEAAKYGINVLLEAVHSGLTDYLTHTNEAVKIVKALKGLDTEELDPEMVKLADIGIAGRKRPENLWIVYDYYNAKAMGEGLLDMIDAMPLVKHLHYSTDLGNNDRGYPGPGELEEVTRFLQMAADNGYEGNISVEANYGKYLPHDGDLCARLMRMALPR